MPTTSTTKVGKMMNHTKNKNKKTFSCIKEKKIYAKFLNSIYIETTDVDNKTHTHDSNFAQTTKNTEQQILKVLNIIIKHHQVPHIH